MPDRFSTTTTWLGRRHKNHDKTHAGFAASFRTAQTREMPRWLRGEYDEAHLNVPVRGLHGMDDPVITPTLLRGYSYRFSDFQLETVDGVGHWIVEQRPELVLERLRACCASPKVTMTASSRLAATLPAPSPSTHRRTTDTTTHPPPTCARLEQDPPLR